MGEWRERYPEPWRRLSSGRSGVVSLAFDKESQLEVAIKEQEKGERSQREVDILKKLKAEGCEQVVEFLNYFEEGSLCYIVMAYYPLGTLGQYIFKCYRLGVKQAASAFSQLATAIYTLHRLKLHHGDLHSGNVLVAEADREGYIRLILADFGEATTERPNQPTTTTSRDDLGYDSPSSDDVVNLGLLLHQMLTGKIPRDENYDGRGAPIFDAEYSEHLNPAVRGLLQSLMHQDEDKRIVMTDDMHAFLLCQHPFMVSATEFPFTRTINQEMDREFKKMVENTTTRCICPRTGKEFWSVPGCLIVSKEVLHSAMTDFQRRLHNTIMDHRDYL